ncbi:MAG: helix-hairpin-helix domain-containing protein [Pedobacter sp.]|nr:MAG: helix-hairpin-helix domain-containing protein [Pedobacter sp.]
MLFKVLTFLLLISFSAHSQEDQIIKEIIDGIIDDLPEDVDLSELTDRLLSLKKNPINLNKTSLNELKDIFFLSPIQITNFLSYLSKHGKLLDILELQAIPSFDVTTIRKLLPFVKISEVSIETSIGVKNLTRLGQNDFVIRYGSTIQTQKGFRNLAGTKYIGTPEKLVLRYKYNLAKQISMSLVMEKDAGERLAINYIDFISANLTINNIKIFDRISLGDYSLRFGQGLTLWSGFSLGKGPDVATIVKNDEGLKQYSSTNEYSFFRGIATKMSISKKISITSFWSLRSHDASLSLNENGEKTLTSLNETGYHRTQNELKNKNIISQNSFGSVIEYVGENLTLGAIIYNSRFDKIFVNSGAAYRQFNFTGKILTNTGIFYSYSYKNIYLFGEFAKSLQSGAASTNGLLVSLTNYVSVVLKHRNYQKNYHNFYNQAPSESGGSNESGFYAGLNISPSKTWLFSIYIDYFKFPWLRFRVDAPSKGYEVLSQITYTPSKTLKASVRFKTELKQQNTDLESHILYLEDITRSSLRFDLNWKFGKFIFLQNRLEFSHFKKGDNTPEFGYLIYQDIAFQPTNSNFTANLRIGRFKTQSFNSRLYAYEDDMLYNYSLGMYNGDGFRTYLNTKYKLYKKLSMWLRYSISIYKGAKTVGSGLDEILGNKKSEVKVQLRYQF